MARWRPAGRSAVVQAPEQRRAGWWPVAGLIVAVVFAYSNSLSGPFVLDDQAAIVTNESIRDAGRIDNVLVPEPDSPVAGRPVANLTFALNYAWGGLDVTGYHVVNIALHAACAVLLMLVSGRTLQLPGVPARVRPHAQAMAFSIALIWAVHPLNSEVVDYLSQRTESLMALFLLLTLYAAIRACEGGWRWELLATAVCALGTLTKESMAVAPVIVAVYDRVLMFDTWKAAVSVRRRLYAGLATSWLILAALVASAPRAEVAGFGAGVPMWTNLLNQAVMITRYLRLAVWPSDLVAIYGWHERLALGDVLAQVALICCLAVGTMVALRRAPLLGFAGAWLFITLAPTSSVLPIATEVGAERRMYLPSVAVVGFIIVALTLVAVKLIRGRAVWMMAPTIALIATALGMTTLARNREYASGLTLARTIVDRRPTGIGYHILGEQLQLAGREVEAIPVLRDAVSRGNSRAGLGLGRALINQRDYSAGIDALDAFLRTANQTLVPRWLEPSITEVVATRLLMGDVFVALGNGDRAAAQAEMVLTPFPQHVEAHALLGAARFIQQRWPEAIAVYRRYLNARPNDVQALVNVGVASVAIGAMDDAVDSFQRAASIDPRHQRARTLLDMALKDRAALSSSAAGSDSR